MSTTSSDTVSAPDTSDSRRGIFSELRQLLTLKSFAPRIYRILLVLLMGEILFALVGPSMIPNSWFLSLYLPPEAKDATERFLRRDAELIPDRYAGWKNRPNLSKGTWVIDEHGARSVRPIQVDSPRGTRIMLLGSSMTNGGMSVRNDETLSAYLEKQDESLEVLNFGTMLYGMDQSYLRYKHELHRYRPALLVIEIRPNPTSQLTTHYLPLSERDQKKMPYLKPRFNLDDRGTLVEISVDAETLLRDFPHQPALYERLSRSDSYNRDFESFKRFGVFPLSALARYSWIEGRKLKRKISVDEHEVKLLSAIMTAFEAEARHQRTPILFIALPELRQGLRKKLFPDQFKEILAALRKDRHDIVDVGEFLAKANVPLATLYWDDKLHYSAKGNEVIARGLLAEIHRRIDAQRTPN